MKLTLETDYALRIIAVLAKTNGKLEAKSIAERAEVTLRFSLKILRKLTKSGLVASFKGAYGGYILGKKPEEITVGDVIKVIEGDLSINRCCADSYFCKYTKDDACLFHDFFHEVSADLQKKLDSFNFGMI